MVIYKLNFCAASLTVYHTSACGYSDDYLFIEGAADCPSRKLIYQHRSCAEHATSRTANILPIDKEVRITLGKFYQCFVDCSQHWQLLFGLSRDILLPFGNVHDMFQDTFGCWFRLLKNLCFSAFQF